MKESGKKNDQIELWEETAFYESGLCAHGCLENLDRYALEAIKKYGRYLLTAQKQYFEHNNELVY